MSHGGLGAAARHAGAVADGLIYYVLMMLAVAAAMGARAGRVPRPDPISLVIARIGYYALPMLPDPDRLWIPAQIDGRTNLLLVDTGFSLTTLDPQFAGPAPAPTGVIHPEMNSAAARWEGTNWQVIRRLSLGRAHFENLAVRLMDLRAGKEKGAGAQGMLGVDFLRQHHALIFCGDNRLLLNGHALPPAEQLELDETLRTAGYREIALEAMRELTWAVPVQWAEAKGKLLVDTGAQFTVLDAEAARQWGVKPHGFGIKLVGVQEAEAKGRRARLTDFQVGDFPVRQAEVLVGPVANWGTHVPAGTTVPERTPIQGMLGLDFFRSHAAVIDCQAGKLWLRKPVK